MAYGVTLVAICLFEAVILPPNLERKLIMKITIEAEPKEIAALVLEIQGRQSAVLNCSVQISDRNSNDLIVEDDQASGVVGKVPVFNNCIR
jgi:hypothetical protein